MSTPDDQPPSDQPPPKKTTIHVKRVIGKLTSKYELSDYVRHLVFYDGEQHLVDEATRLREGLLLQGLDEEDLFDIHEFLHIKFDGNIMKIANKGITERRTRELEKYLQ